MAVKTARRQTGANDGLVYWHIYESLGFDKVISYPFSWFCGGWMSWYCPSLIKMDHWNICTGTHDDIDANIITDRHIYVWTTLCRLMKSMVFININGRTGTYSMTIIIHGFIILLYYMSRDNYAEFIHWDESTAILSLNSWDDDRHTLSNASSLYPVGRWLWAKYDIRLYHVDVGWILPMIINSYLSL